MRILLADDHAMMRDGLKALLLQAGLDVVGEAASGREALALAATLSPDLVVMDVSMPELNGIEATRRIRSAHPRIQILGLSMHADKRYVTSMMRAGASGYLLKKSASAELILAIDALARGEIYLSAAVTPLDEWGSTPTELDEPKPGRTLTPREREVLQLIAEGHSSKEIATSLGIALPTVETHRRQLMAKLELRTIAELTKHAIREGLTLLEK